MQASRSVSAVEAANLNVPVEVDDPSARRFRREEMLTRKNMQVMMSAGVEAQT